MARTNAATSGLWIVSLALLPVAAAQTTDSQPTSQPAGTKAEAASTAALQPSRTRTAGPFFDVEYLSFDLGFEGRYDRRSVKQHQNYSYFHRTNYFQKNREYGFEEILGLESEGSIADKRILRYNVAARWGMSQDWLKESRPAWDRNKNPHGDVLEYDLNFALLPHGTVSTNAFAQQLDSRVPRAFQPSLDRTRERYGADVLVNNNTFPMRFTYEHVWDELTSRTRSLRDDEQRGSDKFRYEGTWQISERQAFRIEYEYEDREERYSGTNTRFDTDRHYIVLNHTFRFGPEGKSSLETVGRFQDERGDLARDVLDVSTQLKLQHTESLSTNYKAQYLKESFDEWGTRTWRGEAGVTHQLGDYWTNSLQFYGLKQGADENADFSEWGGIASSSFNRANKWGDFGANLSYTHVGMDTDDGTRRGVVIAESVTLRDPLPAFLAHADADLLSIVVTDANRTRTYLPVRDYVALRVGRYVSLRRVPTGQIADRQTVLVSYTYRVSSDYVVGRDRVDLRIQQKFKFGLTPYYAASIQNEDRTNSRFRRFASRDVNRHRIGATYTRKNWSCGAEYEYNYETIDPYQAVHSNIDAVLWQNAKAQLGGQGSFSYFWFDGTRDLASRDTALLDLGLSYRYTLARDLELDAAALYRYEDDSFYGVTNGVDLSGALEWKIGYFALRFEAEYDLLDLPGSNDRGFSAWLKLRRGIPAIARSDR